MSVTHFQSTCQALIQVTVEALATAPHFTQAQKKTRTAAVVDLIMAFLPTEPIQVMLASQAVGHHLSLMDTFQQIHNRALADAISVKMRTISTMETRMTLALARELRIVRKDMIAAAQEERTAERTAGRTAEQTAEQTAPVEQSPVEQPRVDQSLVEKSRLDPPAVPPLVRKPAQMAEPAAPTAGGTVDDATFAAHIADYENAFLALEETLLEARALDKPAADAAHAHLAGIAPPGLAAAE